MLDTVILNIPRDKVYDIGNPKGMKPWELHSSTSAYKKFTKNPPRGLKDGIYRPRLTGIKRMIGAGHMSWFVRIEFSVAKLLFGNNLQEVSENDFQQVIDLLSNRLQETGILIHKTDIINSVVATVHPSKNIVLSEGYAASLVSKELSKININKKFDLTKTTFMNDGQSLQGYTIAHSVVFYDKIADLTKGKRRAVDKDQMPDQLSLFAAIKKENPSLEILRFEVRICRKQKLDAVLRKLGFQPNATFKDIFKRDICQKIVKYYWDTLVKGENLFLFGLTQTPKRLLKEILRHEDKIKPKEAIFLVGLHTLCRDDKGIRELRLILEKYTKQRNWYRFGDSIKRLNHLQDKRAVFGWVRQVESAIDRFEPIRTLIGLPEP